MGAQFHSTSVLDFVYIDLQAIGKIRDGIFLGL